MALMASLCGVLVFDSVSRLLRLLRRLLFTRHLSSTHHLCHPPSVFQIHIQLCHTPSFTHNFVTHHLSHTIFYTPSFTHTFTHHLSHTIFHTPSLTHHLSHTSLSTTIFHTSSFTHHLLHTPSFTHNFVTRSLSHTTFTHTIFHTQLCHTHHLSLSHTIFHIHLCHTQLCFTSRSSTTSFVFPSFPVPATTFGARYWKKLPCGVIRSFYFIPRSEENLET